MVHTLAEYRACAQRIALALDAQAAIDYRREREWFRHALTEEQPPDRIEAQRAYERALTLQHEDTSPNLSNRTYQ